MNHSPKLLAHRGSVSEYSPENTLASFQNAIDLGASAIETDVRATSDQVAVLIHDSNFRRIAKRDIKISNLTYEQAKLIELTGGQHVISLADALNWFPNASFNIDIKSQDAIVATATAINESKSWERVLITSFSNRRRKKTIAKLDQPAATSPGATLVLAIYIASLMPGTSLLRKLTKGLFAVQIPTNYSLLRLDSEKFISKLHSVGLEVHYWVVNSQNEAVRLAAMGADALVTDDITSIRAALI